MERKRPHALVFGLSSLPLVVVVTPSEEEEFEFEVAAFDVGSPSEEAEGSSS